MVHCFMEKFPEVIPSGMVHLSAKAYNEFMSSQTENHFDGKNVKKFKVCFQRNKNEKSSELTMREFEIQFQKKYDPERRAEASRENGKLGGRPTKSAIDKLKDLLMGIEPYCRDFCVLEAMTFVEIEEKKKREAILEHVKERGVRLPHYCSQTFEQPKT